MHENAGEVNAERAPILDTMSAAHTASSGGDLTSVETSINSPARRFPTRESLATPGSTSSVAGFRVPSSTPDKGSNGLPPNTSLASTPAPTELMTALHALHDEALGGIATIQTNTSKVIAAKESDMMRLFKQYIKQFEASVQVRLNSPELAVTEDPHSMASRLKQTVSQLEIAQSTALLFEDKFRCTVQENRGLRRALASHEAEKNELLKQLVLCRRDLKESRRELSVLTNRTSEVPAASDEPVESTEPTPPESPAVAILEKHLADRKKVEISKRNRRTKRLAHMRTLTYSHHIIVVPTMCL